MVCASSAPDEPLACARRSRYCPATISVRMARHSSNSPGPCGEASAVSVSRSSAHASARSPASTAADVPNDSADPPVRPDPLVWSGRCPWVKSTCIAGAPRRSGDPSITSSWMRAQAWSSSRAAPVRRTALASPEPPAARQPHHTNAVRSRLPPRRTYAARRSAMSRANTASASRACRSRVSRTRSRTTSMARMAPVAPGAVSGAWCASAGPAAVGRGPCMRHPFSLPVIRTSVLPRTAVFRMRRVPGSRPRTGLWVAIRAVGREPGCRSRSGSSITPGCGPRSGPSVTPGFRW